VRRAILSGAGLLAAAVFTIAATPQRIVSVSPVVTEILYGVGAFDKVVAVTEYCTYPPEAKALPKVGGWATPSVEKVAGFHPDLVAFSEAQAPFLEKQLKQLGIRLVLAPSQTIRDAFTAFDAIGQATGHERQATELAARTRAALDAVRMRAGRLPRPTVLIIVDRTPGALRDMYAAQPGSFLAELVEIAGGKVVAAPSGAGYGKISPENVLAANPDIILDILQSANAGNAEAAWRELPELNAVRRGSVRRVRDDFVTHDSQRIAQTAVLFAKLLHPEVPVREWEVH
jgi:iron complex transport system substrate-binding protein